MSGAPGDPRSVVDAPSDGPPAMAFGKYQLFASLGRGGMADVYLCVARGQMGFNKLAVVKKLRASLAEEAAFRTMFLDEARLAARLSHPNIVHTYEVGEQDGVYFIAMEYLEGQSLNKVLKELARRRETMAPEVAVRIVADALGGLHYAHELRDYDGRPLGIIHRDVSPHNVFVTYDGHTKLVDFGIAKAALSSTETEIGVLKGKVSYMAPEQATGGRIDARADVFAMGIVLWELLTRQRLMAGENAANTLHRLMNEPIPAVSHIVPGIDPELDAICAKALEKDPIYRWQSAAEMRDALEAWLRSIHSQARHEDVGRTMVHLFAPVREEVQRQIQHHMAGTASATNSQELQILTAESLRRMDRTGDGQLLLLNGGGSGSGVVPSYGLGRVPDGYDPAQPLDLAAAESEAPPSGTVPTLEDAPKETSTTLLVLVAAGFFALAALLIVIWGLRARRPVVTAAPVPIPVEVAPSAVPPVLVPVPVPVDAVPPAPVATTLPPAAPTTTVATTATSRAPTAAPLPPSTKAGRPAAAAPRPAAPHPPAPPPAAAPTDDKEPGYLTINAYPWARVSEGTKVLCAATPCNKIALSPGTHTLSLENPDQGLKQTTTVVIKSGETTTRALGFK